MISRIERTDLEEAEAMRRGSEELRNRIFAMLADRQAKFDAQVQGHSQARRAIAKGIAPETVKSMFDLSDTAYEQLAGQVRGGFTS
jgi:ABC-type histidine transport system ATPase subunit